MAKDNRPPAEPFVSETDKPVLERIEEFKTDPDIPRDLGIPNPTEELREVARAGSAALKEKARDKLYEMAATMAMQMELGEYIGLDGVRWDPKPFVMTEILRRFGYSESYVERGSRPAWFPGMGDFRRYVAYLKAVREVDYSQSYSATKPMVEMLFVAATVELAARLMDPRKRKGIAMRELTDLFTKTHRAFAITSHGAPPPLAPGEMSKGGSIVYQNIQQTILTLPEGPARDHAFALFKRAMHEGAESLPAPKDAIEVASNVVEKQEVAS